MGLIVRASSGSGGGTDFTPIEAGTHIAVCGMVVDLGIQPSNNPAYDPKHQIYIRWEVAAERVEWEVGGKQMEGPAVIGSFYSFSLHEKANLRRDLEGWRGKQFTEDELSGFELFKLLGAGCQLSVIHYESGGKTRAKVQGIMALPKSMAKPDVEGEVIGYSPEGSSVDGEDVAADEVLKKLPEWLQKIIDKQITPKDTTVADAVAAGFDDVNDGEDEPPF